MSERSIKLKVFVAGRVQGVGFRFWTEMAARRLGLLGYVRNLRDGRVEAVFEGESDTVHEMLGVLQGGPPGAQVESVKAEWGAPAGEFADFEIRR